MVYVCGELLFLAITVAYVILPAVLHLIYGGRHFMYYTFVPSVDETTLNGYILLTVLQSFGPYIGFVGHCATDLTFLLIVLHLWPMTNIFAREISDLNATLKSHDPAQKLLKRMQLRNVMLMHKELFK